MARRTTPSPDPRLAIETRTRRSAGPGDPEPRFRGRDEARWPAPSRPVRQRSASGIGVVDDLDDGGERVVRDHVDRRQRHRRGRRSGDRRTRDRRRPVAVVGEREARRQLALQSDAGGGEADGADDPGGGLTGHEDHRSTVAEDRGLLDRDGQPLVACPRGALCRHLDGHLPDRAGRGAFQGRAAVTVRGESQSGRELVHPDGRHRVPVGFDHVRRTRVTEHEGRLGRQREGRPGVRGVRVGLGHAGRAAQQRQHPEHDRHDHDHRTPRLRRAG